MERRAASGGVSGKIMIMKVVQYYIFSVEEMQLVVSDVKYT